MDEDKIEDIYLYFKEDAESDSLDAAIEELGADYTEGKRSASCASSSSANRATDRGVMR